MNYLDPCRALLISERTLSLACALLLPVLQVSKFIFPDRHMGIVLAEFIYCIYKLNAIPRKVVICEA